MTSEINNSISTFPILLQGIENIQKTDDDGLIQIYSYKHCDNSTKDSWDYRGVVFNGEKHLFRSLGYTPEYNDMEKEKFEKDITTPFSEFTFFRSEEGTLLRLFCVTNDEKDKWYLTTHRKLDAFKSRWGSSSSFGDIFLDSFSSSPKEEVMSILTSQLNKDSVYFFLIRNTSANRVVAKAPSHSSSLFFIGEMNVKDGLFLSNSNPNFSGLDIQKQEEQKFENWDQVFQYVKEVDPFDCQGIIGFHNGSTVKVINNKYQLYSQVRGNEASLMYRYLHVRTNPLYLKMINEIYPEHIGTFAVYENNIFKIAKAIHTAYVNRFVNKQHVVVSQEEYRIVSECHGWYISNRQTNKVTLSVVINTLSQDKFASTLYQILKRYMDIGPKNVNNS